MFDVKVAALVVAILVLILAPIINRSSIVEMNIEPQKIKDLRHQRAWSQAQLAQASGLGLRTIQRVEKTGFASPETVQSLASVFECKVTDLLADLSVGSNLLANEVAEPSLIAAISTPVIGEVNETRLPRSTSRRNIGFSFAAIGAALVLGFGVTNLARARDVHLTVRVLFDNQEQGIHRLIVKAGEPALIISKEQYRLSITPTIVEQQRVFLTTLWDEFDFAAQPPQFSAVAKPRLLVNNQTQAAFGMTTKSGKALRVEITPEISLTTKPI